MQQLVITAVGPDRPGLLDELTGWLLDAGANVADSRMVNLGGQFALILLAEAPAETDDSFCDRLSFAGQELGLTVQVCPQSTDPSTRRVGVPFQLRVYAMDQPGIIHRITHVLHEHGVNVEELCRRDLSQVRTAARHFPPCLCT